MSEASILDRDADALSAAIHARRVSCREVMQATLARIRALNPRLNAIVSLADEASLLAQADERDRELARGESRGWLHGIPQALKDSCPVAGFPTTYGSPLLKDNVAAADGLMASRLKAAGCIVVGKTNMPEFGLGSHTFNSLFGATRNAWAPEASAGGSSGGAAVALAARLLAVVDGSDYMGSLRNPAAWNHVWGLRPSQGRVPAWPARDAWVGQLATEGPMARTVRDLARLLDLQSGHDPRAPLSIAVTGGRPFATVERDASVRGLRIGWLADLGGHLAIEPGILPLCERALQRLAGEGASVEPAMLGVAPEPLWRAWLVWRHALVMPVIANLLKRPGAREAIKPEALWEHDQGTTLSAMAFMQASEVRTAFHAQLLRLFESHDLLALPVTQVWPFPVEQRWPTHVAGREMDTYHRWMEVTLYATFGGLPALSMPAGFDEATGRLPAGVQLIGPPAGEAVLLRAAFVYERTIGELMQRRPPATD